MGVTANNYQRQICIFTVTYLKFILQEKKIKNKNTRSNKSELLFIWHYIQMLIIKKRISVIVSLS